MNVSFGGSGEMNVSKEEFVKKIQAMMDAQNAKKAEAAKKADAEYRAYVAARQIRYLRYKKTGHYR